MTTRRDFLARFLGSAAAMSGLPLIGETPWVPPIRSFDAGTDSADAIRGCCCAPMTATVTIAWAYGMVREYRSVPIRHEKDGTWSVGLPGDCPYL